MATAQGILTNGSISLGNFEMIMDFFSNPDEYEPELTEVKATISEKKPIEIVKKPVIKPKLTREGLINKFSLVSTIVEIKNDSVITDDLIVNESDDFDFDDFDFDNIPKSSDSNSKIEDKIVEDIKDNTDMDFTDDDINLDNIDNDIDMPDIDSLIGDEEDEDNNEDNNEIEIDIPDFDEDDEDISTVQTKNTIGGIEIDIDFDDDDDEDDGDVDVINEKPVQSQKIDDTPTKDINNNKDDIDGIEIDIDLDDEDDEDGDNDDIEIDIPDFDDIDDIDFEDTQPKQQKTDTKASVNLNNQSNLDSKQVNKLNQSSQASNIDKKEIKDNELDLDDLEDCIDIEDGDNDNIDIDIEDDEFEDDDSIDIDIDIDAMDDIELDDTDESSNKKEITHVNDKVSDKKISLKDTFIDDPSTNITKTEESKIDKSNDNSQLLAELEKLRKENSRLRGGYQNNKIKRKDFVDNIDTEKIVNKNVDVASSKYDKYTVMNIDALYNVVMAFMVKKGVKHKPVDINELNLEFGADNIKKLIVKQYLIKTKKGVTVGL